MFSSRRTVFVGLSKCLCNEFTVQSDTARGKNIPLPQHSQAQQLMFVKWQHPLGPLCVSHEAHVISMTAKYGICNKYHGYKIAVF
jgi:hypothetical protein